MTRATMLEVPSEDDSRMARAKGLGTGPIRFGRTLNDAAIPTVTVIGIGAAPLIAGAAVTERVFAFPGLGRLTVDALFRRYAPVTQGIVLMVSIIDVLVNRLTDILYTALNPCIRYCSLAMRAASAAAFWAPAVAIAGR